MFVFAAWPFQNILCCYVIFSWQPKKSQNSKHVVWQSLWFDHVGGVTISMWLDSLRKKNFVPDKSSPIAHKNLRELYERCLGGQHKYLHFASFSGEKSWLVGQSVVKFFGILKFGSCSVMGGKLWRMAYLWRFYLHYFMRKKRYSISVY